MNRWPNSTDNPRAVVESREAIAWASTSCPNFSVLTAFIEHRLGDADRDAITRHFLQCEACYFTVTEAARPPSAAPRGGVWRWTTVSTLAAAAVLALAVTTNVLFVSRAVRTTTGQSNPTGQPPQVIAERSDSASVMPANGCAEPALSENDLRLAKTLRAYQASVEDTRGDSLKANYFPNDAVRADATSQNERAAAYLVQWKRTRRLEDAATAFDAAKSAVGSDPNLIDAQFNLALAIEAVSTSLGDESRHAWERYLAIDSTSSHADEARRRLRARGR